MRTKKPVPVSALALKTDWQSRRCTGCIRLMAVSPIEPEDYYPIEREGSRCNRQTEKSVSVPLQTGILSIDSMFPIGQWTERVDHR